MIQIELLQPIIISWSSISLVEISKSAAQGVLVLRGPVAGVLLFEVHLPIGTLLVLHDEVVVQLLVDRFLQVLHVPHVRVGLDLVRHLWILLEDILKQELLGEREALDWLHADVDEFAPKVIHDVVITDDELLGELLDTSELILVNQVVTLEPRVPGALLRLEEVADLDEALEAEVHFRDLVLFVVDDLVFPIILGVEVSGQEAVGDIVQELLLPVRVLGGLKEEFEVLEDVIEQVVSH